VATGVGALDRPLEPHEHLGGALPALVTAEFAKGIDHLRKPIQDSCALLHVR
jgi:hypothetical protein